MTAHPADGAAISRWRQTRFLALATILLFAATALTILFLRNALDSRSFLGMPLFLFASAIVLPVLGAGLIFWITMRQQRLDESYGSFRD